MDLISAAGKGDVDEMQRLIFPNEKSSKTTTTTKTLFPAPIVNVTDGAGNSALHAAVANSRLGAAEFLLRCGADPNQRGRLGFTPLHLATQRSTDKSLMELLVRHGANVFARTDVGATILHAAATTGNETGMTFALEAGVNVNAREYARPSAVGHRRGGLTPLHNLALCTNPLSSLTSSLFPSSSSSTSSSSSLFSLLSSSGADVRAADFAGWNLLHFGAGAGNEDAVGFGAEMGVDAAAMTVCGRTPLDVAVECGSHPGILSILHRTIGNDPIPPSTLPPYPMRSERRGLLLIFNNRKFVDFDFDLPAAEKLGRTLTRAFSPLGFDVDERVDLSPAEMLRVATHARDRATPTHDVFACAILSHGDGNEIVGHDGSLVSISEIASLFSAENCQVLAGKPKLFFIDACQGESLWNAASDARDVSFPSPHLLTSSSSSEEEDFFFGYSTLDGCVSWRDREIGSLYVETLARLLLDMRGCDLRDIHRRVEKRVSEVGKQKPHSRSTLKKALFLS